MDKLFGMPDEVNAFYEEGKQAYLTAMDGVIGEVADVVGAELGAARARIAQGRTDVQKYVAQLPEDLKEVGREAADKLESQFEQLSSDVDAKQNALVDTLAKKYVEARDALDARIEELQAANKGFVSKALDAVGGMVETILGLKNMLMGVLSRAADVIGDIIKDPIGFLGNLVSGVKAGLSSFVGNIATHLKDGLMGWLFGALGSAGITMPKALDLQGILDLVLQVLGLTWQNVRMRAAKIIGEPLMAKMERTVDVFKDFAAKGIAGAWEWIKDKIGDLEEMVLGQIKEFVTSKIIKAGITWIISLLNPAAAFIKACKAIYDIVMWIVERGSQLMEFVNAVLDSIGAIAKGSIGAVVEKVEGALSKALPVAISFLASLLGLGGISEKIRSIIDTVQEPINKAIDFVVGGAVKTFKKLFAGPIAAAKRKYEKGKDYVKGKVDQGKAYVKDKASALKDRFMPGSKKEKPKPEDEKQDEPSKPVSTDFAMAGKPHTLTASTDAGGQVRLVMASVTPGILIDKANATRLAYASTNPTAASAIEKFIGSLKTDLEEFEEDVRTQQPHNVDAKSTVLVRKIAAGLEAIGAEHRLTDLSYEKLGLPEIELNRLVYDAMIQARKKLLERRENPAAERPSPGDSTAKRFDAMMQATSKAYVTACDATIGRGEDVAGFTGNLFEFAGVSYFVDHDANYIVPNAVVKQRKVVWPPEPGEKGKIQATDRNLPGEYAYSGDKRSINVYRDEALRLAEGGQMGPAAGAVFLAAMIAEPHRNLNAHVTNLLLLTEGGKQNMVGNQGAAPMTRGGTATADKSRDATLTSLVPNKESTTPPEKEPQPPIEVTDAEIKLVREHFETSPLTLKALDSSPGPLGPLVEKHREDKVKAALIEFLLREPEGWNDPR